MSYIRYPSTNPIAVYPTAAAFPTPGSGFALDDSTNALYYWDSSAWTLVAVGVSTVTSVNGQVGAVFLDTDDIPEGSLNLYYTDERAQDAVGTILVDSASVDLTYNDGTPSITADVLPAGVNHNALQNYVANQHIDHSTVIISAGTGLTGGGDITASRSIDMPNVGTPGTYGSASAVPVLTTDTQGRVSAVVPTSIDITASQVSDFTEAAQDAVGGALTDTVSVDLSYNDAGNTISADVLPAGVNHDALQNYVANQHIDHSTVNITAGTGLTGGGDITTSRSLALTNTGVVAGSYRQTNLTVDAQGRLTAATSGVGAAFLAADQSTTSGTAVDITGLALTLAANTVYFFSLNALAESAASNRGVRFGFTFSGTTTYFSYQADSPTSTTARTTDNATSIATTTTAGAMIAANTPQYDQVNGMISVGASGGTFQAQFFVSTAGTTVTLRAGTQFSVTPSV